MKNIKIDVVLRIGLQGAEHKGTIVIEVPKNATKEELDEIKDREANEWAWNFIEIQWRNHSKSSKPF